MNYVALYKDYYINVTYQEKTRLYTFLSLSFLPLITNLYLLI